MRLRARIALQLLLGLLLLSLLWVPTEPEWWDYWGGCWRRSAAPYDPINGSPAHRIQYRWSWDCLPRYDPSPPTPAPLVAPSTPMTNLGSAASTPVTIQLPPLVLATPVVLPLMLMTQLALMLLGGIGVAWLNRRRLVPDAARAVQLAIGGAVIAAALAATVLVPPRRLLTVGRANPARALEGRVRFVPIWRPLAIPYIRDFDVEVSSNATVDPDPIVTAAWIDERIDWSLVGMEQVAVLLTGLCVLLAAFRRRPATRSDGSGWPASR